MKNPMAWLYNKNCLFPTNFGKGAPIIQKPFQAKTATTYLYRSTRVQLVGNANV